MKVPTMKELSRTILITLGIIFSAGVIWYFMQVNFDSINPVEYFNAKQRIENHIEETYPDNDFEKIQVRYLIEYEGYGAHVQSKSSIDTYFDIYINGSLLVDDYDNVVTSGIRTYDRLNSKFDNQVDELMRNAYGDSAKRGRYSIYSENSESRKVSVLYDTLGLDGDIDITELKSYGFEPSLIVILEEEDMTHENCAQHLVDVDNLMKVNGIYVSLYSMALHFPEDMRPGRFREEIMVNGFPAELVGGDEMVDLIMEYDGVS